jgi:hypothetical protein
MGVADVLNPHSFKVFAERVVAGRIGTPLAARGLTALGPAEMFPGLSELEEANLLLEDSQVAEMKARVAPRLSAEEVERLNSAHPGELFFIHYWTKGDPQAMAVGLRGWWNGERTWINRFNNHFYASLFSIRKGKRGIRKYYCGWDVLLALANGNIRYLLELVHSAFKGVADRRHTDVQRIHVWADFLKAMLAAQAATSERQKKEAS